MIVFQWGVQLRRCHLSLSNIVREVSALRIRRRMQPVGGPGDVVYPPTYADGSVRHKRIIDGKPVDCVLLDSVASQANRMELALRDHKENPIPQLSVDVAGFTVTSLDAPHRFTDTIMRSCENYPGQVLLDRDRRELFGYAPSTLLFGCWHSNRKGGSGLRIPRAISSELVAVNTQDAPHVASRVDSLPFSKSSKIEVIKDESTVENLDGWSLAKAAKGKPSDALLGNIPPSIDVDRGITMEYAEQICVISITALRKLELGDVATTALVAMGLAGFEWAFADCWLRSRCHLMVEGEACWESIKGPVVDKLTLDVNKEFADAIAAVKNSDLPWRGTTTLTPKEKLIKLVEEGRLAIGTKEQAGKEEK